MDLLILLIVLVVAVLATVTGFALSKRSLRRQEEAERRAAEEARRAPTPKAPVQPPPPVAEPELEVVVEPEVVVVPVRPRLRDRLGKARELLAGLVGDLRSRDRIDDDTWDELEEALIRADVGVVTTGRILDDLRLRVKETAASSPDELLDLLKTDLVEQLATAERTLTVVPGELNVWMFVGVNGVGKTTTIGKFGQQQTAQGRSVVMAAADTFRAAAAEQLELWSKRVGADLVRGQEGADPGSVVFDALSAAQNRGAELVLVDTAGRLHTKVNLMEELKKLRRIVDRTPGALKEVLLVIDATTGQNGLVQAKQFGEAVDVTGVVLTKLDGTARGGIVLAVQAELGIPVKVIGVGETADDLIEFDPEEFVDALFAG
ncbi:MAG: signal recognition particle-docking protein FtsY [Actinomycetota bacterium]|nr:signal recognition particle-docking protein FtsY [Actinomycetota bacterium]